MRPNEKESRFWECVKDCETVVKKPKRTFNDLDAFTRSFHMAIWWYSDLLKLRASELESIARGRAT